MRYLTLATIAMLSHAAMACVDRSSTPLTVTIVRQGSGGAIRTAGSTAKIGGQRPVTIVVKNESASDTKLDQLVAMIVDAQGHVSLRSTVARQRMIKAGTSASFQKQFSGQWAEDAVLGIAATFDGRMDRDGSCTPVCLACGSAKSEKACEQFWLLLEREQPQHEALGAAPSEQGPPNRRLQPPAPGAILRRRG